MNSTSRFVCRSVATKSIPAVAVWLRVRHAAEFAYQLIGLVDSSLGFRRPRLRSAAQPLLLDLEHDFRGPPAACPERGDTLPSFRENCCSCRYSEARHLDRRDSTRRLRSQFLPENTGRGSPPRRRTKPPPAVTPATRSRPDQGGLLAHRAEARRDSAPALRQSPAVSAIHPKM